MKSHTISELVDLSTIRKLAEGHYQSTGMPVGIIDAIDGSVLVATGWQDICTLFHRAQPSSLRYCRESDNFIKGHLIDGEACRYRCKNGLWDIGVPVFVAKRHLATIFLGQFFYEGETPDRDYFIRQAQRYGYNLAEYLAALDRVPVFTKEKVDGIIAYNKYFSRFMAELAERSLSNFEAEQALRDSEYKFRVLTETSPAAIFLYQEEKIVYANPATAKMLGFAKDELLETMLWDWLPSTLKDGVRQSDGSGPSPFECKFVTKSGGERWGYISTGWTEYQGNPAGIVIIHDITKKKEAEEARQRESALVRCVIDSVSDLIFIKDPDGVYLRCNRASEEFIGLSESEQAGKTDFDFFDREKAEAVQKLDRQVLAEGKPLRIEEWVTDADGARIIFDTLKAPYYGPDGEVMGLVGISRDITARKRAQDALAESEARYRRIVDTATEGIWVVGPDSMTTFVNARMAEMLGCPGEDMIGRSFADFMFEEDTPDHLRKMENRGQGLSGSYERRFRHKDGQTVWTHVSAAPIFDDEHQFIGSFAMFTDITERKRAEEALRESEARYRMIVETAEEGIWQVDHEWKTTYVNRRMERMLGCEPGGMLGRPLFDFMDKEGRRTVAELISRRELGIRETHDFRFLRCDGSPLDALVSASPLVDDRGEFVGSFAMVTDITERKRAEEALRESEARYRQIVDTATEGIWAIGPDSMTTFVNARMAEMLGCTGEEMIGRSFADFMFEEDVTDHLRKLENRRHGTSESYERRFRHKNGRTMWTHISASPIFDDDHNFVGSFAMFTDITERKRMETELKESEARYRHSSNLLASILESSVSVSVYALDREYRYLAFNRRHREGAKRLWGADITVGMSILDAIDTDEHREFCRQGYDKVLEGRAYFVESREVISGDGRQTVEYRDNYGSPIFNDDGDVVGLTVFAIDITARKEAEEEIRFLKNYLANIIDSMPSILVGMDRDETVTQWNRHAEKISGIPSSKAIGRPITELFPDFSPWIEAMRSKIDRQRPASMEKLLIEKEGERRFYDLMLYPLVGNGVEGAVIRIEDATERARIQELMIQTEKMMSVGGLAAGMAHEINNPLGIITQAAQNIERRVSPGLPANREAAEELGVELERINAYFEKRRIPEFVGSIREASLRASRIIANMLQFSRRSGLTMQPVSPAGIIEQALELAGSDYDLKKKFDFRSIEIIRDYAPDMPEVPMVMVEMEQVMLNLLKNAAQAMIVNPPDHRPRIVLRLRREERYALIEVEDNGPGMKEDVRRRVFEPFFTTKEPGMGTGLGLSVSYMIVTQNHKGLMDVESKPGKGACFRIRLPLSNSV